MTARPYRCPACGADYAVIPPRWRCDCGSPLDLGPGPGLARADVATEDASLWRYAAALVLPGSPGVSLGEGWTPLVLRTWRGVPVFFKLESQMPTGSFKDRGTAVMLNHLIGAGIGSVHEDSSGNAGASLAAYAAAAGLRCRIYVPAGAPIAKLAQIAAAGAELHRVAGSRETVAAAAVAATYDSFYASHNWHPFFIEGTKTLAFELWEQLGWRIPDNILVPTGYGSNILGLDRGFDDLVRRGEIIRRPRLFAVQAANCAALAAAWAAGDDDFVPFTARPTIADGIATLRPVRLAQVLKALRRSAGGVVTVAEPEIGPALAALGRLGLFVEPTAATAAAALTNLLYDGTIGPEETTVVVLTGHGLKAAERIGELLAVGAVPLLQREKRQS